MQKQYLHQHTPIVSMGDEIKKGDGYSRQRINKKWSILGKNLRVAFMKF